MCPREVVEKRKATGRSGVVTVSRTAFGQVDEEKSYLEIRPFATDTVRVGVKLGRTLNLGNYESARVDVSLDIPCYVEEVKAVYADTLAYVSSLLSEEVAKISQAVSPDRQHSVEELL